MGSSATATAGVEAGSGLALWQGLTYFVVAPLVLLLAVAALAWWTATPRKPGHYPVLRGAALRGPAVDGRAGQAGPE